MVDTEPFVSIAYRASSYLEQLLMKGAIVPEPSQELDQVYAKYATASTSPSPASSSTEHKPSEDLDSDASSTTKEASSHSKNPAEHRHLLLTRDAVPDVLDVLKLKPDSVFAAETYRALEQAALRLQKSEPDLKP